LEKYSESVNKVLAKAAEGSITLPYGAIDEKFNNAVISKKFLEQKIKNM
jgi:uncharacterized protein YeaO (DUF488 family)